MTMLPEPMFGREGNVWARAVAKLLLATERAAANADARAGNVQSAVSSLSARVAGLTASILSQVSSLIATAISALTFDSISGTLDQSRVTSTWTKDVNTTNGIFTNISVGGLTSTAMYANLITPGTVRDIQIRSDGVVGYVASSARFKSDIAEFRFDDPKIILALKLVSYYYSADPNKRPDVGVIAEQVHALGFWWLVDYDDDWKPFGFKYAKLSLAILPYLANVEERLQRLEAQSTQVPEPSAST